MLSHFDANYLWGAFADPERAYVVLSASSIADAQRFLVRTKEQPGVAWAQLDIPVKCITFPEKMGGCSPAEGLNSSQYNKISEDGELLRSFDSSQTPPAPGIRQRAG